MTIELHEVKRRVRNDPAFAAQLKDDPVEALSDVAGVLESDPWVYRIVVTFLGLAVLLTVLGAIALAFRGGAEIPAVLTALGSASVGALAGLLAPSPGERVRRS